MLTKYVATCHNAATKAKTQRRLETVGAQKRRQQNRAQKVGAVCAQYIRTTIRQKFTARRQFCAANPSPILSYSFNVFKYLYVFSIVFNVGTRKAYTFSNRTHKKAENGEMLIR